MEYTPGPWRYIEHVDGTFGVEKELKELMDGVVDGSYTPDSFTTQPARIIIAKVEGTNDHRTDGQIENGDDDRR